jgi:putative endonuclease
MGSLVRAQPGEQNKASYQSESDGLAFLFFPMTFSVYIIYSPKLDSFYVGTTDNFSQRLEEHNSGKDKSSFTYRGIFWEKFLIIDNLESKQAFWLETKIKSMKSKRYIINLKKYPELIEKLIDMSLVRSR